MKTFRLLWNIVTTTLVVIAALLAVALVGVRAVGLTPFTVLSSSMEPTYKTGSIVYVKKVDVKTLKVGDAITFMLDENTIATHRIYEVVNGGEDPSDVYYVTKGDANESIDANMVNSKNVIGKPVLSIPQLGYLADFIQNKPGRYITIAACALILLFAFLPDLFSKKSEYDGKRAKTK